MRVHTHTHTHTCILMHMHTHHHSNMWYASSNIIVFHNKPQPNLASLYFWKVALYKKAEQWHLGQW